MSNLRPFAGPQAQVPTPPQGEAIGRYGTYAEAQRAVDFLSDEQFPVQNVTIVGTGLQMVERVTGRLTYGRAAGAGAASGAWFGLLIGLMLSVFGNAGMAGLLTGLLVGAGFGMLFAVISYALTGGRRDFTSASQIVAGEYTVLCAPQLAGQAREVLGRLPNGLGRESAGPGGHSRWGDPAAGYGPPSSSSRGPGAYGPPPQPGSAPLQQPAPPHPTSSTGSTPVGASAPSLTKGESAAEPEVVLDLSGPTYAEKMEEQRRERRAAEQREREEQARQGS